MKAYTLTSFLDKIAGLVLVSAGILTAFAVIVAVGVVYNSARIALQERAWELASLRVLGFTRAEVAQILFGQFAIEIALAIPIGLLLSQGIVTLIARFHSSESFQIPGVVGPRTYAVATADRRGHRRWQAPTSCAAGSTGSIWSRYSRRGIDDAHHARSCGYGAGPCGCGRRRQLVPDAAAGAGRNGDRHQRTFCRHRRRGWQDTRPRALCGGSPARRAFDARAAEGRRHRRRRRYRCHHHAAAGAPARSAQPPRGRGKTGHRRSRAAAQQGHGRARAGPGRSGQDRSRSRPHPCRAGRGNRCRRWNAPNSRSGSPIAIFGPRNSRITRRTTRSSRRRPCSRAIRTARTHRSNAGTSRRRYPAWC